MTKNLLYTLRNEKDISIEKLAQQVGVQAATLSKWENGAIYPSESKMKRLAIALGVELELIASVAPRCMIPNCPMKTYQGGFCKTHYYVNNPRQTRTTITDSMRAARTMGKRLQLLRCSRSISKEKMAQIFGVSVNTVEAWEMNLVKPTLHMLLDIAAYFVVGTRFIERGVVERG